jgi:hypothetical protein
MREQGAADISATASFQHMKDAADDAQIVSAGVAVRVGGKWSDIFPNMRLDQTKLIPIHRRFLSEAMNCNALNMRAFLGSAPNSELGNEARKGAVRGNYSFQATLRAARSTDWFGDASICSKAGRRR